MIITIFTIASTTDPFFSPEVTFLRTSASCPPLFRLEIPKSTVCYTRARAFS